MRRGLFALVAALSLSALGVPPAFGQPGDLDTSFSGDGVLTKQLVPGQPTSIASIVGWPDGRILAAGRTGPDGAEDLVLARFLAGGAMDGSFGGGDGVVTLDVAGGNDDAGSVLVDPAGRIVVVGSVETGGTYRFDAARFGPGGALDTSFSGDGMRITAVGSDSLAYAGALDAKGRIVAAGWAQVSTTPYRGRFALVRYRADGHLDATFGDGGILTPNVSGVADMWASAVAIDAKGRIVVAGTWRKDTTSARRWVVMRLRPDGSFDPAFSGDGRLLLGGWPGASGGESGGAEDVVIDAGGQIVVAGYQTIAGRENVALARLLPGGTFDRTFSGDGRAAFRPKGSDVEANAATLDAKGRILAIGQTASGSIVVTRVRAGGRLDGNFGAGGFAFADVSGGADYGNTGFVDAKGRLVIGGSSYGFAIRRGVLARFLTR